MKISERIKPIFINNPFLDFFGTTLFTSSKSSLPKFKLEVKKDLSNSCLRVCSFFFISSSFACSNNCCIEVLLLTIVPVLDFKSPNKSKLSVLSVKSLSTLVLVVASASDTCSSNYFLTCKDFKIL